MDKHECPRCLDRYMHGSDAKVLREMGMCIHCIAETNTANALARVVKICKYPLVNVLKFHEVARTIK
jgi:hypothetical protein